MIPKWVAIWFLSLPLIGASIYRFVLEPLNHPHPGVHQDWWMRGEGYMILTLAMMYVLMALIICFTKWEKKENEDS